ncbi:hypothetical protein BCR33DRAFT_718286 [Rhizoclosmatium globosum]|uniref:Ankyrin n=1 Tax=Rhizoclosmatium globosum TaxID=329046 RepID=A0A1Y2C6D5_9FUNG|nr:hypothetical protein BCR33DRAFT_718286 [Rhizoclosmatium globosum]|eukprot:ORY42598.1 hypothetical protein BCR33DRAFT_718286 [Rhizoclosmatium globosum]
MSPAATESQLLTAIQRKDSELLTSYLQELDAAMPAAESGKSSISATATYLGLTSGDAAIISTLLANGANPALLDNGALIANAEANRTDIVTLLLADVRVDPLAENGRALVLAAARSNTAMFKALYSRIPASAAWDYTLPLALAAKLGNHEVSKLCVEYIARHPPTPEQRVRLNMSLVFAAINGNAQVLRDVLSIKDINVKFANDAAYLAAIKHENHECAQILNETGRINHEEHFASSRPIDLDIASPSWWVPQTVGAIKFYSQVVNTQ